MRLLLLQQRGLLLSDVEAEIAEATCAELVVVHARAGVWSHGGVAHLGCAVSVLDLAELLGLLLLVVLGGSEDVLREHLVSVLLSKLLLSSK